MAKLKRSEGPAGARFARAADSGGGGGRVDAGPSAARSCPPAPAPAGTRPSSCAMPRAHDIGGNRCRTSRRQRNARNRGGASSGSILTIKPASTPG